MKRAMRRALREWKEEFNRHWQRLNTFMRMVTGILLAMGIVWWANNRLIGSMQKKVTEIRETNKSVDLPYGNLPPEEDPEVQENRLKEENLQKSLEQARARVADTVGQMRIASPTRKGEVLNTLDDLLTRHGLLLRSSREIENPQNPGIPIPFSQHQYTVTGSFLAMHRFLHEASSFPHLSRFNDFKIRMMTDEHERPRRLPGGAVSLEMEFLCTLYYYNE